MERDICMAPPEVEEADPEKEWVLKEVVCCSKMDDTPHHSCPVQGTYLCRGYPLQMYEYWPLSEILLSPQNRRKKIEKRMVHWRS
jgi:hypothetical protein